MQINVAQLLQSTVGAKRKYQVSEAVDIAGDGKGRLVEGEIDLLRTDRSILARVKLQAEVELTCSRCLSIFISPLTLDFEEEYIPTIDIISGVRLPSSEEAGAFIVDEHHIIDLTEAIRQYAEIAVPMKPLCREVCDGLCQQCGQNLNLGDCNCPAEKIDPRWSRLTELR